MYIISNQNDFCCLRKLDRPEFKKKKGGGRRKNIWLCVGLALFEP